MKSTDFSRRAVLKGAGASLTLPFLPSFVPGATSSAATISSGTGRPPRRYAAVVFSNGVNLRHWWERTDQSEGKRSGKTLELGKSQQALEPFKDDILFLNHLQLFDHTSGVHTPFFTNFLTGLEVQQGSVPVNEQSVDQLMAHTVGRATPVPGIVLGIEPTGFGLAGDKPAIYRGTISWRSSTSPVTPEIFPRQAFDRLFDTRTLVRDKSVLDLVLEESKDVSRNLTAHDRDKLDKYMESIREIERRIEMASSEGRLEGWQPSLLEPDMPRPDAGTPQSVPEHMRLMTDIMVLAFQMDKTRVATLLMQRDLSNMMFDFLEGVGKTGLHNLSHHRNQSDALAQYQITNQYHAEQFAHLLSRMKSIDEGNGTTLLDNTALLFGSTMADGNAHQGHTLRLAVAGGKSMGIRHGRSLWYDKLEDRRLCNLHLDLAQRMGVTQRDPHDPEKVIPLQKFSNSHYPLPGVGDPVEPTA